MQLISIRFAKRVFPISKLSGAYTNHSVNIFNKLALLIVGLAQMLKKIIELSKTKDAEALVKITNLLVAEYPEYTWAGFYLMNHQTNELHLGPYTGPATDHTIIPFGKGICGQVANSGETYIAQDVASETNYIACSLDVKSEIVLPIYYQGKLLAQLDIDSNVPNAFSPERTKWFEQLSSSIGENLGQHLIFS